MIRKVVASGFYVDTTSGDQAPYKMLNATDKTTLPPPTAVDRHGEDLTPERAMQLRVDAALQDLPEGDRPSQPAINGEAYTFVSTVAAQERVDRRRGALGLERPGATAASTARAGPRGLTRPGTSSDRSRPTSRVGDLRELIKKPLPPRDPREQKYSGASRHSSSSSSARRSRSPQRPRTYSYDSRHAEPSKRRRSPDTSRSRSPTGGKGRGLKKIPRTSTRDQGYAGAAERHMAERRRKHAEELQEEEEKKKKADKVDRERESSVGTRRRSTTWRSPAGTPGS